MSKKVIHGDTVYASVSAAAREMKITEHLARYILDNGGIIFGKRFEYYYGQAVAKDSKQPGLVQARRSDGPLMRTVCTSGIGVLRK